MTHERSCGILNTARAFNDDVTVYDSDNFYYY